MAARDLSAPFRAAVDTYAMIGEGDRVAVGVSGGKDSVALLVLLAQLRRFYPHRFELTAITLDPCFDGIAGDYTQITELCERLDVPYILKRTKLWDAVQEHIGEENPCSLCARLRRGTLHRVAKEAGCNTVALGHHQDDAAETVLMNLLSGATIGCFSPKSYLDRSDITLIRPMIFLSEKEIDAFVKREGLPIIPSRCPVDGVTHRQQTKELIAELSRTYGDVSKKITDALQKGQISNW
ncbi:MAG: tRNA 2-thiocytidine biosynthesis protein TtcA [Clostridia bacterium]|nr:tRNA 2-thiocytidine biosynthesis protein TtcA [Clostridia bacterium]